VLLKFSEPLAWGRFVVSGLPSLVTSEGTVDCDYFEKKKKRWWCELPYDRGYNAEGHEVRRRPHKLNCLTAGQLEAEDSEQADKPNRAEIGAGTSYLGKASSAVGQIVGLGSACSEAISFGVQGQR